MITNSITVRPRYIHVSCSGRFDRESFVLALNQGLDRATSSGRKAVVMDALNVDGTLSKAERFVLGDEIAYAQRAHGFVAIIAVVANEPPLEAERLAEKVAINRGAVGQSFTELPAAERWIEEYLANLAAGDAPGDSGSVPR
jgi:hypothetical protein